jgi:exopolyphosphatase / guanosine-5'-triphosphate,3'-diphosphate pyrophosphatase
MRLGAIDVGTNTTRLLIAEATGDGYRELDRRLIFTRLGEGVDAGKVLQPGAMKRTLAAIAEFCSLCGEFGVERVQVAGTSAVRDAGNSKDFLEAAGRLSGSPAVALTGDQEARLSFWGATGDLAVGRCVVCDIGGGSTEFVMGDPASEIAGRISLDLGSVRLTERYLVSDPPATEEILTMEAAIDDLLAQAEDQLADVSGAELIGLGGTVTTLAAVYLGLDSYLPESVDRTGVRREPLDALYRNLARMTLAERSRIPVLPEGRADVIVAGAAILSRMMAKWAFEQVVVSEKDILDGLLLQMMGRLDDRGMPG